MQLGMIGLGRMGNGMTERLREHDHDVKTYDPAVESRTAASLEELKSQLDAPRAFWMMIPAGKITEDTFQQLLTLADAGDTIVDGGNSNFRDSQRRYAEAAGEGHPLRRRRHLRRHLGAQGRLLPDGRRRRRAGEAARAGLHRARARRTATRTSAPSGAGHFAKMVHNGIEYGLMQAYAEGLRGDGALRVRPRPRTRSPASGATARSSARGCSSCCTTRSSSTAASSTTSRRTSRTPARAAGRSTRRSPRTCRRR